MDGIVTRDGVRDGLRRCQVQIVEDDNLLANIEQQVAALTAERAQAINRRERLKKARAALEALRLVLDAESGLGDPSAKDHTNPIVG